MISKYLDGVQASGIHFYIYYEADRECVYMYEQTDWLVVFVCH